MPRATVLLNGKDWRATRSALERLSKNRDSPLTDWGVIVEGFTECFGWPDFIVTLWGANVELIKSAIIILRDECGGAYTSTYIGVTEDERKQKGEELRGVGKFDLGGTAMSSKLSDETISEIVEGYIKVERERLRRVEGAKKPSPG